MGGASGTRTRTRPRTEADAERTALRRRPQANEKRSRRARRKTPFWPRVCRVDRKTIAKWKGRKFSSYVRMGPKNPRSKFLTPEDEPIILAYRWLAPLSLDDLHVKT